MIYILCILAFLLDMFDVFINFTKPMELHEDTLLFDKNQAKVSEILFDFEARKRGGDSIDFNLFVETLDIFLQSQSNNSFEACQMILSFLTRIRFEDEYDMPYLIELIVEKLCKLLSKHSFIRGLPNKKEEIHLKQALALLIDNIKYVTDNQKICTLISCLENFTAPFYLLCTDTLRKNLQNSSFSIEYKAPAGLNSVTEISQIKLWKKNPSANDYTRESYFNNYLIYYFKQPDNQNLVRECVYEPLGKLVFGHFEAKATNKKNIQKIDSQDLNNIMIELNRTKGKSFNLISSKKHKLSNLLTYPIYVLTDFKGYPEAEKMISNLSNQLRLTSSKDEASRMVATIEYHNQQLIFEFYYEESIDFLMQVDELVSELLSINAVASAFYCFNEIITSKYKEIRVSQLTSLLVNFMQSEFKIPNFEKSNKIKGSRTFYFKLLKPDIWEVITKKCECEDEEAVAGFILIELIRFFANVIKCETMKLNMAMAQDFDKVKKELQKLINIGSKYVFSIKTFIESLSIQPKEIYHLMFLMTEQSKNQSSFQDFIKYYEKRINPNN